MAKEPGPWPQRGGPCLDPSKRKCQNLKRVNWKMNEWVCLVECKRVSALPPRVALGLNLYELLIINPYFQTVKSTPFSFCMPTSSILTHYQTVQNKIQARCNVGFDNTTTTLGYLYDTLQPIQVKWQCCKTKILNAAATFGWKVG
jgi:hypothetical protein